MADEKNPHGQKGEGGHKPEDRPRKGGALSFPDSFVSKVVSDPGSPPAVVLVSGYPGQSSWEGQVRFYLNADLSAWIDVPEDAVVHIEQVPLEMVWPPLVMAWVRQDARMVPGVRGYSRQ